MPGDHRAAVGRRHGARRSAADRIARPVRHAVRAQRAKRCRSRSFTCRPGRAPSPRRRILRRRSTLLDRAQPACSWAAASISGTGKAVVLATGASHVLRRDGVEAGRAATARRRSTWASTRQLAADPVHARDGPDRLLHQRLAQRRSGWTPSSSPSRRGRPYAGNAADDRERQPRARRDGDVAAEDHRQAAERDPEPRRDGHPLHRQDRHADAGPRRADQHTWTCTGESSERVLAARLPEQFLFQTGSEEPARPRRGRARRGTRAARTRPSLSGRSTRFRSTSTGVGCRSCSEQSSDINMLCLQRRGRGDAAGLRARRGRRPCLAADGRRCASKLKRLRDELNEDGLRVVAVGYKAIEPGSSTLSASRTRTNLIFSGFIAFLDPPKDTAAEALRLLRDAQRHGQDPDRRQRRRSPGKICRDVACRSQARRHGRGNRAPRRTRLWPSSPSARRSSPSFLRSRRRASCRALKARGHTVGFMGDGINDATALREADVGISVDSGRGRGEGGADIILLEKSLLVLEHGVIEGRRTFGNIIKYIKMTASSNFGNVLQRAGRERVPAVPADAADPAARAEPALRPLADLHPVGPHGRGLRQAAAAVGGEQHRHVHALHRADQFDLRHHDVR